MNVNETTKRDTILALKDDDDDSSTKRKTHNNVLRILLSLHSNNLNRISMLLSDINYDWPTKLVVKKTCLTAVV